jgi:hypothetical protein
MTVCWLALLLLTLSPVYVAPEEAPDPDDEYCPDPMPIPEQPASMATRTPSPSFPIIFLLFDVREKARQNYHGSVLEYGSSAANIVLVFGNCFSASARCSKKPTVSHNYVRIARQLVRLHLAPVKAQR